MTMLQPEPESSAPPARLTAQESLMDPQHGRAVVILPTYNEADNLPQIVPAILAAAPVDIMIVDDSSPDGTGALADALGARYPRIQVVHRPSKEGLGAAYLDGFARALAQDYEHIIEMDADFSHPPERLPEMLRLSQDYDLVLGSRWVRGGGTRNWPWLRQVISRGGSLYARRMLGVDVRDMTGGFKCFRRRVLDAIDFSAVRAAGYAFQIEMTYRTLCRGFTVKEMPIVFTERTQGCSKMSRAIVAEALLQVPRIRREARRRAAAALELLPPDAGAHP